MKRWVPRLLTIEQKHRRELQKKRRLPSAGKVMPSVSWDAHGIIFIDYFQKGKTLTTSIM